MKQVNFVIEDSLHKEIKKLAAEKETTIKKLIVNLLAKEIEKEKEQTL